MRYVEACFLCTNSTEPSKKLNKIKRREGERECRVTLIICGCGKIVYMSHVEFHILMREIL